MIRTLNMISVLTTLLALALTATPAASQGFTQSNFISFTLEGCRNDGSITLPIGGKFVCPDAAYTTGNLGKGWNELDLVPHRLTTSAGNQNGVTTSYDIYVAADNVTGGKTGYDVIWSDVGNTAPEVNAAKSDASCSATWGPQSYQGTATNPFGGGTDTVTYRQLTVNQAAGSTCVFDYYQRLALGSHLYPGSSLQSYLFEQAGLTGSKKTISIPVNQILPQSIAKTMAAAENSDHVWDITKSTTPASLNFPNTCDPTLPLTKGGLAITVTWTKEPAVLGFITVTTKVYATNPSARTITTTVSDSIYSGSTLLDTAPSTTVNVPPNTANVLLLTHKITNVAAGTTNLNDIATATYTDTVTGIPIPGTTTATASANVQLNELNNSATITDVEQIASPFQFSVDSTSGASGVFTSYTEGAFTNGPLTWTSASQGDSSSVTFNKTISATAFTTGSANLQDTATLAGSDGAAASASLTSEIQVSAEALVNLTIIKSITNGPLPSGSTPQTFTFHVFNGNNVEVQTPTITLNGGDTSNSVLLTGLQADTYTVTEGDPPASWTRGTATCGAGITCQAVANGVSIPLSGTSTATCANAVTFTNTFAPQELTVSKDAQTSFDRTYTWAIAKAVDQTKMTKLAGETATFNYTVTVSHDSGTDSNFTAAGNITINNPNFYPVTVDVTDTGCTVANGTGVSVPAGGTVTLGYSCSYGASLPSENTATVAVQGGTTYTASATLVKGDPTKIIDGNVTVTDPNSPDPPLPATVSYTDPSPKEFPYSKDVIAPDGTCTKVDNTATFVTDTTGAKGDAIQQVEVCGVLGPNVTKTAASTFTRTYAWQIFKDVDYTKLNVGPDGTATFNYKIKVTHDGGTDSAWQVAGNITVTNPNQDAAITVDVSDVIPGGACTVTGGTNLPVLAKDSKTVPYVCTFNANPGSGTNTATVAWTYSDASLGGSNSATADFAFGVPTTVVDGNVTVTDPNAPNPALGSASYTQDNPIVFTYSQTFPGVAGKCTDHNNTATFTTDTTGSTGKASQTVTVCEYLDLTVTKTAVPSFTRTFTWGISKGVDQTQQTIKDGTATFNYTVNVTHDSGTDSLWKVVGQITVHNPNEIDVAGVTVADAVDNGGACSVPTDITVPAGGYYDVEYSCLYASAPTKAAGTNTATVSWPDIGTPHTSASGSAGFDIGTPTTVIDDSVNVTDTLGGVLGTLTSASSSPSAFTYSHSFPGVSGDCTDYDNTGTFTTNDTGKTGSASQTVTVCLAADLQVTKTAVPTFARAYLWKIAKVANPLSATVQAGSTATYTYNVTVSQTGLTDSGWTVTGLITITNPNVFESVTVNVADTVDNGGSCTVTDGLGVVVPKAGSQTVSYSCTYASMPSSYSGTNTVTAAVTNGSTPSNSYTGSKAFMFADPAMTNKTVHVTDTLGGSLGSVTATDSMPYATGTFTYVNTLTAPFSLDCVSVPNTATITETGQPANASVSICSQPGYAAVVKTVQGQPVTGTLEFTFQLRQGASSTQVGTTLETQIANATNGGNLIFGTKLVPGATYQMCEIVMPGWLTSLGQFVPDSFIPPDGIVYNPNVDNSILCANFIAESGSTKAFTIDNTPPPGGRALTIGFWKNWASCAKSNGNQKPVLDQTLAVFDPTIGLVVSATSGSYALFGPAYYLQLHGSTATPNMAPDCQAAVNLLSKLTIDGKKKASDPAFNLAAQLVAAELNFGAAAGKTPAAITAVNQAVLLLGKYQFNGITYKKASAADITIMNNLAKILDDYNNDR